jgi:ABC-type branched-subunit amino acid transport system permease subunit
VAAAVTLAATPLFGQRSEIENLIVLCLPLALIARAVQERWNRTGTGMATGLMLGLVAGEWWLFTGRAGGLGLPAEELAFLYLPIATLVALYWMRWWALRAPRMWAASNGPE